RTASCVRVSDGLATGNTWPTASEYFRYVSMEATTTRASTVMRSIPTRDPRTPASMTMPLSSTRSSTSMMLVPPLLRSTGIDAPPPRGARRTWDGRTPAQGPEFRQRGNSALQWGPLLPQRLVLRGERPRAGGQMGIVLPPVEPDLLGLVEGADDEPDAAGAQLA